jgi:uncharacterized membrane protein
MPAKKPSLNTASGLDPRVLALLCYLLPPLSSVVFLYLEKDNQDIQFHAWQGTAFGVVAVFILFFFLRFVIILFSFVAGFLGQLVSLASPFIWLTALTLWIVCMVKAYQGERWRIPIIGDFAAQKAGL